MHTQLTILNSLRQMTHHPLTTMSTERAIKAYSGSLEDSESTYESQALASLISDFHAGNLSSRESKHLRHILCTRLDLQNRVNRFVKVLGIKYLPPIEVWNEGWTALLGTVFSKEEFERIYFVILESGLLSIPPDEDGHPVLYYLKPARYLAATFCVAGYGVRDVQRAVGRMWEVYEGRKGYVLSHKFRFGGRLGSNLKGIGSEGLGYGKYEGTRRCKNPLKKGFRGLKRFGDSMLNDVGSAIVV